MRVGYVVIALGSIGCVVNGKAYGGSTAGTEATSASATDTHAPAPADRSSAASGGYLSVPAEPWAGVAGDGPVRWTAADANHWKADDTTLDACTARRDHCLVRDTWFIVRPQDLARHAKYGTGVGAVAAVFGPDGPVKPWNARSGLMGDTYVAFRTVPATRQTLVAGRIAIGLVDGSALPTSGKAAIEASWAYGEVESVDLEHGTYAIKGRDEPLALVGARVAVLSWQPGGNVEVVAGISRDQLAVRANDLFVPAR